MKTEQKIAVIGLGNSGLNQSIRIEVFGDLHEAGAVGKTVTLEEARQLANYVYLCTIITLVN